LLNGRDTNEVIPLENCYGGSTVETSAAHAVQRRGDQIIRGRLRYLCTGVRQRGAWLTAEIGCDISDHGM
ncbi:MAG TPA: hypothetical protein VGA66_16465, partial [Mycobacterium sp.]